MTHLHAASPHLRSGNQPFLLGADIYTNVLIRFHIAHLYEVCGRHPEAKGQYTVLLEEPHLPTQLKADIYRQMGWMHHSVEAFGEKNTRIEQAIQFLQKSIDLEPKSGQSHYLHGRCYASIGKVHDAFIAYRTSVDKSESNADTWCSIGVLYQQQNQPMDALQAYICAVQLDKDHWAAWTNLGILYESQSQPHDALACYTNATRNRSLNPNLHQRIKYLKTQMASAPPPATSKPRSLPTVEEAWNLPISNEMTNRGAQPRQGMNRAGQPVKKEDGSHATPQPQQRPQFYLTQQQLQTLQYLQNQPSLLPQQQQLLQQLKHQFRMMQQHQQQMRLQQQQQQAAAGIPRPIQPQGQFSGQSAPSTAAASSSSASGDIDGINVSDKELESLLSQQDIGSFAESLLKQFQEMAGTSGESSENKEGNNSSSTTDTKPDAAGLASALAKAVGESKAKNEVEKATDLMETMDIDHLDIPTSLDIVQQETYHPPELNIKMTADEIVNTCEKAVSKKGRISTAILPEDQPPPSPPDRPSITLTKEQLLPPTPSVYLENKKDAFSPQLQEFCLQHPITVVRGIAAALKLDLGLFATKTLLETQPEHPVKVRSHLKQGSDENWDQTASQQVWRCSSQESMTTISGYAKYQVATFQEAFQLEHEKTVSHRTEEEITGRKKKKNIPTLKHGYCVDLSFEHKFRQQLQV